MKTVKRKIKKKKTETVVAAKPVVLQKKKDWSAENEQKRLVYLDNLRTAVIILIIVLQGFFLFNRYSTLGTIGHFEGKHYQDVILYLTYPWVHQILFVMAGMTAHYYLESHSLMEFIRNRTRKYLVPSTVGVLLYHWIEGVYTMRITNAGEYYSDVHGILKYLLTAAMGINVLWFLQMLWLVSMVLALIVWLEKGKLYARTQNLPFLVLLVLGIGAYGAYQVLNINIYAGYAVGGSLYLFLLGYLVLAHREVQEKIESNWIALVSCTVVCGAAYVFFYFGEDFRKGDALRGPLAIAYSYLFVLALIALGRKYMGKKNKTWDWMNARSFGMYVFQYAPMLIGGYYLYNYTYLYKFAYYAIVIALGIGVGLLMNGIVRKIPVVRWCLLGISDKKVEEKTNGISK